MKGGTVPAAAARKIMVVADPTRESAAALQYALSHVIAVEDEMILLHVGNPNSWRSAISTYFRKPGPLSTSGTTTASEGGGGGGGGELDFLEEMKHACKVALPKLCVHIERVEMEGKDKAATILSISGALSVDLLIIGQRRSLSAAILGSKRGGGSGRGIRAVDTAEYLIDNSKCTCVGVQKKGQNAGYLLNTKTHKNFWLLA